jgi:galactoside O-acetyltransferase
VVTKDIPADCLALGTPARVIRKITEQDDLYYDGGREIPEEIRSRYIGK